MKNYFVFFSLMSELGISARECMLLSIIFHESKDSPCNLTNHQLAEMLGVGERSVSRWIGKLSSLNLVLLDTQISGSGAIRTMEIPECRTKEQMKNAVSSLLPHAKMATPLDKMATPPLKTLETPPPPRQNGDPPHPPSVAFQTDTLLTNLSVGVGGERKHHQHQFELVDRNSTDEQVSEMVEDIRKNFKTIQWMLFQPFSSWWMEEADGTMVLFEGDEGRRLKISVLNDILKAYNEKDGRELIRLSLVLSLGSEYKEHMDPLVKKYFRTQGSLNQQIELAATRYFDNILLRTGDFDQNFNHICSTTSRSVKNWFVERWAKNLN